MNKISILILLLVAIFIQVSSSPVDLDEQEALEFLQQKRELDLVKRMLYTGKEQRREAKEKYEEKCERKLISKAVNKARWCPELTDWAEWNKVAQNEKKKDKKLFG